MKVAFVYPHSEFSTPVPKLFDALAIVTYELARRLARRAEVIVYPRRAKDETQEATMEGVLLHRIAVRQDDMLSSLKLLDRLGLTARDRPFRLTGLYFRPYAEKVAADVARRGVDVVHIYGVASFIPVIRRAAPKAVIVLHSHDHALVDFDRALTLARLRQADLVLGCSEHVTANIRRRFPELVERCETLVNGVDQRFFDTPRRSGPGRSILFIGRLSPEKGVHVLLEAFARLREGRPDLRLDLVGPDDVAPKQFVDPFARDPVFEGLAGHYDRRGSYAQAIRRRAEEIGGVTFHGPVDNAEIADRHAAADVFCFPSIWQEPFGMPLIEAMASGLPVVATDAGAFPEIVVDGTTGSLVPRGDVEALALALGRMLDDPAAAARMGEAGRARAREVFDWDRQAGRLAELYARFGAPVAEKAGEEAPCASPS